MKYILLALSLLSCSAHGMMQQHILCRHEKENRIVQQGMFPVLLKKLAPRVNHMVLPNNYLEAQPDSLRLFMEELFKVNKTLISITVGVDTWKRYDLLRIFSLDTIRE